MGPASSGVGKFKIRRRLINGSTTNAGGSFTTGTEKSAKMGSPGEGGPPGRTLRGMAKRKHQMNNLQRCAPLASYSPMRVHDKGKNVVLPGKGLSFKWGVAEALNGGG